MNNRMFYINNIVDFFSVLENKVKNLNSLHLYDINTHAENFYRDLLKLVNGYNLKNANDEQKKYPYIDLFGTYFDSDGIEIDIAIQVTSQNGNGKIVDTIKGFFIKTIEDENNIEKKIEIPINREFRLIILLIAHDAKNYQTDFTVNGKFTFNHKEDVIDIKRLLAKIETKTVEELESIWKLLEKDAIKFSSDSQTPRLASKFVPTDFPARNDYFTGREDILQNIANALKKTNTAAIADTHGVGKSSVMNEFAYLNESDYKQILFLRAAKGEFDISVSKLLTSLKIDLPNNATPEQRLSVFQTWLAENNDWLLLVDNVDNVSEVFDCSFNKPNGKVIYTSNDAQIYNVGTRVDLPKMSDDNAVHLLYKHWKNDVDATPEKISAQNRQTLKEIAGKFGNHPFSMAFVGSYLADEQESLDEFLETYQSKQTNLLATYSFLSAYHHKEVATAFLLRFEQISTPKDDTEREKFLSVAVIEYLKLSAYIGTDNIPEELLQQSLAKLYPNQKEQSKGKGFFIKFINLFKPNRHKYTQDETFIKEIYKRFKPTSIFKRDAEIKTLTTHRIVQEIMRFQIGDEEDLLLETLAKVLADNFEHFDFTNKAIVERYLPHVEAFLEYLEANKPPEQTNLKLENKSTAILCNRYARYFQQYGQYAKAEKYYVYFKDICESVEDIDQNLLATSYNNLAGLYEMQGKYELAEKYYLKALKIVEKELGENHSSTATTYNNLAGLYKTQGKYELAEKYCLKDLKISEKELGENHPSTATTYNNLAVLYETQGKYESAEKYYLKALKIVEKELGENHPATATAYNNLAGLYRSQGKYESAEKYYLKALKISEKELGENHPSTATTYNNLAGLYKTQGKYELAEKYYLKDLKISEKELGENHPSTATTYNNLGILYANQEKYAEAKVWLEKALIIRQDVLGNEHPYTIGTRQNLEIVEQRLLGITN